MLLVQKLDNQLVVASCVVSAMMVGCQQSNGPAGVPTSNDAANTADNRAGKNSTDTITDDHSKDANGKKVRSGNPTGKNDMVRKHRPVAERRQIECRLSWLGEEASRKQRVKVRIKNTGSDPVSWDRECSIFVRWHVATDDGKQILPDYPEDQKPLDKNLPRRLVVINPKETFESDFDLSLGVWDFPWGGWPAPQKLIQVL